MIYPNSRNISWVPGSFDKINSTEAKTLEKAAVEAFASLTYSSTSEQVKAALEARKAYVTFVNGFKPIGGVDG